ncbi:MAG: polyprenyl synthetase family protein [Bacteroidales bacterium]|nr:polyprenyl synthetase family protein [Bacteroidales bacterium]
MYSLEQAQDLISETVRNLKFNDEPVELYKPIHYVLSTGGKRIRPVMTIMSANLFTEDIEKAIKPAMGLEIFHNFTLLHDDIMDEADVRRNAPTVHKKWDQNVAILSGDVMAILAYEYITSCKQEKLPQVIQVFNTTARQVCEGQQYDMNFESKNHVGVEDYLKMIEMKTSVLLAGCMEIGAIIGGADDKDAKLLSAFGRDIGMAFQIQDDLLDTYGNQEVFGKEIGGDIVANKKTYLLIKAIENAGNKQREILLNLFSEKTANAKDKIKATKEIFNEMNIEELTRKLALKYFENAGKNLDKVNVSDEKKKGLRHLANILLSREK